MNDHWADYFLAQVWDWGAHITLPPANVTPSSPPVLVQSPPLAEGGPELVGELACARHWVEIGELELARTWLVGIDRPVQAGWEDGATVTERQQHVCQAWSRLAWAWAQAGQAAEARAAAQQALRYAVYVPHAAMQLDWGWLLSPAPIQYALAFAPATPAVVLGTVARHLTRGEGLAAWAQLAELETAEAWGEVLCASVTATQDAPFWDEPAGVEFVRRCATTARERGLPWLLATLAALRPLLQRWQLAAATQAALQPVLHLFALPTSGWY